jgi:hypothetical protein
MNYLRHLWRAEVCGSLALILASVVVGWIFAARQWGCGESCDGADVFKDTFLLTMLIGLLPVLAYGAPIYALLQWKRIAFWPLALFIGGLPGFCAFAFGQLSDPDARILILLSDWLFGCGIVISGTTHALNEFWNLRGHADRTMETSNP